MSESLLAQAVGEVEVDLSTVGVEGVPMPDYVQDNIGAPEPSMSTGTVKALTTKSRKHAWWNHPRLGGAPSSSSSASRKGTAVHREVFGGDDSIVVLDFKDYRTKAAREARDAAEEAGKVPMLKHEWVDIEAAAEPARDALARIGVGRCEVTHLSKVDGVWQRSRHDWIDTDLPIVIDGKSVSCADPVEWAKRVPMGGGYHWQAELGLEGLAQLTGIPLREWRWFWLLIEVEPPYCCSLVEADPAMLELAGEQIARARRLWRECLDTQQWPGFEINLANVYRATPTAWAQYDHQSRIDFEG